MKMYAIFVAVVCFSASLLFVHSKKHVISVYYGADCQRCIDYFQTQIYKNWNKIKRKITLDLLPYGKSTQIFMNGRWLFECQSLQKECLHSKLQVCAIHQACKHPDTRKCTAQGMDKVVRFIHCLMMYEDQFELARNCCNKAGLHFMNLVKCTKGKKGSELLSGIGNRTRAFSSELFYVPMVALDGKHDEKAEEDLLKRVKKLK